MSAAFPWIFSPRYTVDIGAHTFPTAKFQRAAEILCSQGGLRAADRVEPEMPSPEALCRVHTPEWVRRAGVGELTLEDETLLEMPWSKALMEAHALAAGGTLAAARLALENGLGIHVGGGAHHAFADHGEGFCMFNDLAFAIETLRLEKRLARAAVVDLDAHQGNGTASIFKAAPDVFTFSMHQREGYPGRREAGTMDVDLPAGIRDRDYLDLLARRLPAVLDGHEPKLVVYQAGVDVYERDLLGSLKLTAEGIAARDRFVFEACESRRIPIVVTFGGGYAPDVQETAALHARTVQEALAVYKILE